MVPDEFIHVFKTSEVGMLLAGSMLDTTPGLIPGFIAPEADDECVIVTSQ